MSDLVSVIFPVGPGADEAELALADLREQTWGELEIIVVLNGCPERVRESFCSIDDERVLLIDLGAEGNLLQALEVAIDASRGKWLARMDSDDRCSSHRIERTIVPLLSGECEVASCGIELVGALGKGMQRYVDWVNGLGDAERVSRERFVESPVVQPTVMMAKSTLIEAGAYRDDGLAEDYSLWLRLLHQGKRFAKVSERLYQWKDGPTRLTRTHPRYGQREMLILKGRALAEMEEVKGRGIAIAGAGPNGKVIASELLACGITLHGFFEINSKRVGGVCRDRPVVGYSEFGKRWREAILLSAVGSPGGREKVRQKALEEGYEEGADFWCCC